ncbi:MAG: hypothetical protein ACOCRN_01765, partial [Spirochaetia bacterium]
MPPQRDHDPTPLSQTRKRSPKQERDRYLRRLYVLLSLIVILLLVIILLIPDGRAEVAEDSGYVGNPEPQWDEAPSAGGDSPDSGDRRDDGDPPEDGDALDEGDPPEDGDA